MKISSLKVDVKKIEDGEWVDSIPGLEGVRLKVRGSSSKAWRQMSQRLVAAIPRKKRANNVIDIDEQDRINRVVMRDVGLLDWAGIEDDDGNAIPYSKEKAGEYLNAEYPDFRDGVLWACNQVGVANDEDAEATAKN